ncbi:hypothetical protein GCM10009425_38340 [Pseudomonas asuensis]|uniref:Uncharacterized protein n=1 Tax=Pseudomonas asuensis TaxID=1825787 RepID=A0ABQ2H2F0_9PSED|nr:hypothetical protein GCM10009425_38340 [Pseudomonas asuensis]
MFPYRIPKRRIPSWSIRLARTTNTARLEFGIRLPKRLSFTALGIMGGGALDRVSERQGVTCMEPLSIQQ